jgi:hypothetical protein
MPLQLVGKSHPVIVQLDLNTYKFRLRDGFPDPSWRPGQLVFHPDNESLIGTALIVGARNLGVKFTSNRERVVFELSPNGVICKVLSRETRLWAESPRVTPDGKWVCWMERDLHQGGFSGPHQACRRLVKKSLTDENASVETLIPVVQNAEGQVFKGLFVGQLPKRPFSASGTAFMINTTVFVEYLYYFYCNTISFMLVRFID